MKNRLLALPALALLLFAPGCIFDSRQVLLHSDLPGVEARGGRAAPWPGPGSPAALTGAQVDLNESGAYRSHKGDLKDIADLAVLGTIHDLGLSDVDVEVYMTPDFTSLATDSEVTSNGVRVLGPLHVSAGGSQALDWDHSDMLVTAAGKAAILREAKGDGSFTLYAVGTVGQTYQFSLEQGALVLVLDTGL